MVSTRQLPENYAEEAKQEFPKFLSMVKEKRDEVTVTGLEPRTT